ncbi:MAG: hypothetical protein JWQ98_1677 [Chlorobi bacterium]|nr:hypothetical protein [Chlorobiota bacterium]
MKKLIIAVAVAAASLIAHTMNANPSELEWKTIAQALEDAPKQEKLIVLDVYTDWCGWCKRMDKDTYADSTVRAYLNQHFIPSKMNPEKDGKLTYEGKEYTQGEFGQALGIHGYPATVFFDKDGKVLTSVPGYIKSAEFLRILKYFGDGAYKTTKWEDYAAAANGK